MPGKPDLHTSCPRLIWSPCLGLTILIPSNRLLDHLYFSLTSQWSQSCEVQGNLSKKLSSFPSTEWNGSTSASWRILSLPRKMRKLEENKLLGFETIKPPQWQKQWKDVTQQQDMALDFADNLDISELCLFTNPERNRR